MWASEKLAGKNISPPPTPSMNTKRKKKIEQECMILRSSHAISLLESRSDMTNSRFYHLDFC